MKIAALTFGALMLASTAQAQWSDDLETATVGPIAGQNGWELWDPAYPGDVTTAQARSGSNSIRIGQNAAANESDVVYQYYQSGLNPQYASGKWVYKTHQYIPSTMTGTTYFIMMSQYAVGGPYKWAVQVEFTTTDLKIDAGASNNGTATTITDQWVELRVHIDLDADTAEFFYNGEQVGPTYAWTGGPFGGSNSTTTIAAVDLYGNNATDCYYDDFDLYPMVMETHGSGGCAATTGPIGVNVLVPPSLLNGVYAVDFTNLPSSLAVNFFGTSKETYLGLPLPLDLSSIGMPGCVWHTSLDYSTLLLSSTPAPGPYTATSTLPMPGAPSFIGLRLYHQLMAYDPTANAFGFSVSPAVSIVIQP